MSNTSQLLLSQPAAAAPLRLDCLNRETLAGYFRDSWSLYEQLFGMISQPGSLDCQPDPLRLPLAFYLGHTAAFYINKLRAAGLIGRRVHDDWDELFARGVDPANASELKTIDWPDEHSIWAYRQSVYSIVQDVIDSIAYDFQDTALSKALSRYQGSAAWAVVMGIEHERLHWETSSVLLRQAPVNILRAASPWELGPLSAESTSPWSDSTSSLVSIEPALVTIGKSVDDPTFGWDNEYGLLACNVGPFEIGRDLVTNGEFSDFVCDGGYSSPQLWSQQGWVWKSLSEARHPRFWIPLGDDFRYRATFVETELPKNWPVEVNHFEAEAYCNWKGKGFRLPTEAEYRALTQLSDNPMSEFDAMGWNSPYNNHLRFGSPTPVGLSRSGDVVNDLRGSVWQLLADDFYPLPDFKPDPLYADFSSPYFGPDHGMMVGGSWATTGTAASIHYRLWFRRFFFQHAGFRLARSINEAATV